jgi:hypothetical protein
MGTPFPMPMDARERDKNRIKEETGAEERRGVEDLFCSEAHLMRSREERTELIPFSVPSISGFGRFIEISLG